MEVECTNCGEVGPIFWLTLGALLIAATGLAIAFRQHREFMRQLRSWADFQLTLTPHNTDADGVVRTDAGTVMVTAKIGLKNIGRKMAGPTVLNVVVPQGFGLRWADARGGDDLPPHRSRPAAKTPEVLEVDGKGVQGEYVSEELPHVRLRPHYARFIRIKVELPEGGQVAVPVRVKAQADELPEDLDEVSADFVVRVERRPR